MFGLGARKITRQSGPQCNTRSLITAQRWTMVLWIMGLWNPVSLPSLASDKLTFWHACSTSSIPQRHCWHLQLRTVTGIVAPRRLSGVGVKSKECSSQPASP